MYLFGLPVRTCFVLLATEVIVAVFIHLNRASRGPVLPLIKTTAEPLASLSTETSLTGRLRSEDKHAIVVQQSRVTRVSRVMYFLEKKQADYIVFVANIRKMRVHMSGTYPI